MGLHNFSGNNPNDPDDTNNGGGGGGVASMFGPPGMSSPFGGDIDATDLLINYNEKFKTAGDILFRDAVVQQTLSVLISKNKPNPLLVGSAGVGKTKIAEAIAYKLAVDDLILPEKLKGSVIYELPLSNIIEGSGLVGETERKTKSIIEFASDPKNKAILFIDEIHLLADSTDPSYRKIAQILKPALARGDMKVIGATTLQESQMFMNDPALSRRFERLIVDEFTREQTVQILQHVKNEFIQHYSHKVVVDDDALKSCVIFADKYRKNNAHRPDNALTLLDRTMGDAVMKRKVMEKEAQNDPVVLQAIKSVPIVPITEQMLKSTAIKLVTGNNKKENLDVDKLKSELSVIKGQDDIIDTLIDKIKRNDRDDYFEKERPFAMMFAGTSGVGKTQVTKIISKELTGVKPITLNMTEYHSPASINRIIGAPQGYIGYESNAELPFDCLESNPYQVILLDEFEKCDKSVQRLFMDALEDGHIKTSKGKLIDFSKAIIIATTNAGHTTQSKPLGYSTGSKTANKSATVKSLSNWFDVELLNRFDIVTFNEIDEDTYREIILDMYTREVARIRSEHSRVKLDDTISDDKLDEIVKSTYVREFGARPARQAVREHIENQLYN